MILRLRGADFSANNIGKINIIRELRDDTKQLLSNFSKELTTNQQYALQDFIDGLKESGLWSAIGNLYLPILAGDLSETLFNIKTSVLDATPNGESYILENGGLHPIANGTKAYVKYNGSYQNFHAVIYPTETIAKFDNDQFIYGLNDYGYNYCRFGVNVSNNLTCYVAINGAEGVSFGISETENTKKLIGVVQSTIGNMKVGFDNKFGGTPLSTDNTYTDANLAVLSAPHVMRTFGTPIGLISYGTAFSEEQADIYCALSKVFMESMGIVD